MRYLSVCSGIEAASVAWHHLGWEPVGFSEIEPFPSAVLAHRFPNVPNYGDMTTFEEWPIEPGTVDLLVGGTPCQSFSVAGLRKGLEDPRGNLMLTYLAIAARLKPRWIVWENVPGVLSSGGGRDFGTFLGALGELGYGWAYRVLDAQYVRVGPWPRAVPQRRRRVFVVGCLGDWTAAAEVLALKEGLRRHIEAQSKKGKSSAPDAEGGARGGCWWDGSDCAGTLTKQNENGAQRMPDKDNFGAVLQPTAGTLGNRGLRSHTELDGHGAYIPVAFSQNQREEVREVEVPGALAAEPGTHQQTYIAQPVPYDLFQITAPVNRQNRKPGDPCHTLARDNAAHAAVAFANRTRDGVKVPEVMADGVSPALTNPGNGGRSDAINVAVAFQQNQLGEVRCNTVVGTVNTNSNASGRNTPMVAIGDGTERGTPLVPVAPAVAFNDTSATLKGGSGARGYPDPSDGNGHGIVGSPMTVRRLSARECERLQGFPDDWTLIPWRKKPAEECPDGPRYKALGNSMACNCMAWIGERIAAWEAAQ
jgi:DNA (cytosine-5)-methyltransferase 1